MTEAAGIASEPPALRQLAEWAAAFDSSQLAPIQVETARKIVLDVLWGSLCIGSDARALAALETVVTVPGGAVIPATGKSTTPDMAAFVTAMAAAGTDSSDTHQPTGTHPGIVLLPALLAALQTPAGRDGDVLTSLAVGYEIMARIADTLVVPGFADIHRTTAVTAPVAAAMAVARLFGLDASAIASAGSLAANTASGLNQWIRAGTDEHVIHAAMAARNGLTCAQLAASGMRATDTALDGPAGLLAAHGALPRRAHLTSGLGTRFAMSDAVFKPAPACYYAQTPIQLAAAIASAPGFDLSAVREIVVAISPEAAAFPGCAVPGMPVSRQDGVMSIAFGVAVALSGGPMTRSRWDNFSDASLAPVIERIRLVVDPTLADGHGAEIRLDGAVQRQSRFISMDFDAIAERFSATAQPILGTEATGKIVDQVRQLQPGQSAADLIALLVPTTSTILPGMRLAAV